MASGPLAGANVRTGEREEGAVPAAAASGAAGLNAVVGTAPLDSILDEGPPNSHHTCGFSKSDPRTPSNCAHLRIRTTMTAVRSPVRMCITLQRVLHSDAHAARHAISLRHSRCPSCDLLRHSRCPSCYLFAALTLPVIISPAGCAGVHYSVLCERWPQLGWEIDVSLPSRLSMQESPQAPPFTPFVGSGACSHRSPSTRPTANAHYIEGPASEPEWRV